MIFVLDTDVFSIAQHPDSPEARIVRQRILMLPDDVTIGTTIISYDEQTRGWFAFYARARKRNEKLKAYAKLFRHLQDWQRAHVFPFDVPAMDRFEQLTALKLHVGANDLKIAATVLAVGGILVTRNAADFERVPGLQIEDWTK